MVVATRRRRGRRSAPAVKPHELEVAVGEPADFGGRQVCLACHKPGKVGDAQHPDGAGRLQTLPPVPQQVREWEAQRLGERDPDG